MDAADKAAIPVAKEELHALLEKPVLDGIPLLVLGNKFDLPNKMSVDELIEALNMKAISHREVSCYGISAKEKTNLEAVLEWLIMVEDSPTPGVIVASTCILAAASIVSSTSGEASSSTDQQDHHPWAYESPAIDKVRSVSQAKTRILYVLHLRSGRVNNIRFPIPWLTGIRPLDPKLNFKRCMPEIRASVEPNWTLCGSLTHHNPG